jgi:hypothetical protein
MSQPNASQHRGHSNSEAAAVSRIYNEIAKKIQQRIDQSGSTERGFICESELKEIWHDWTKIREVLPTIKNREQLIYIQEKMIVILSVLIFIGAHREFLNLFHKGKVIDPEWNDSNIPFEKDQITFFRSASAGPLSMRFHHDQFAFKPMEIKENEYQSVAPQIRLPFVWKEELIGEGGFGEVSLIEVPRGYLIGPRGPYGKVSLRYSLICSLMRVLI